MQVGHSGDGCGGASALIGGAVNLTVAIDDVELKDPDPTSGPMLLLKLPPAEDELHLIFTFTIRRREETAGTALNGNGNSTNTTINGLTFITASSAREIDNLVTREFHADPNLHKNPNVNLVGDYSTDGSNAVQFDYKWRWRPPQGQDGNASNLGWRNTCSVHIPAPNALLALALLVRCGGKVGADHFCVLRAYSLSNTISVRTSSRRWRNSLSGCHVSNLGPINSVGLNGKANDKNGRLRTSCSMPSIACDQP